ncbi:Ig-like domain-containing protein [Galbibacter orientalis]|uniref:Ig-like domain-containing protein n=1 Tax=Galbibacter orientalis TaxID=453852 RepID=UPI00307FF5C2
MKKTTISKLIFGMLLLILFNQYVHSQTRNFTNSITNQSNVDNATNAIDTDFSTNASIWASSGLLIGIGAYSGNLEVQFPTTVPANTTSYVKIATDENLLPALLGGSLGGLLSDVLGVVLIGNQEFTVQALNGTTPILQGQSEIDNDFAGDRLRIVINSQGEYFIAITPAQAYNRVRLTNRLGSLIGLGNTKSLRMFETYYVSNPSVCADAAFTSFDGSGITLDLLNLGQAGVVNPRNAIDDNPDNYSELNLGILGVLASIQQSIYFEGSSNSTDSYSIKLQLSPSLISVGALDNIRIIASNKGEVVQDVAFSSLLNVDLLSLIQLQANKNLPSTIPFSPGVPIDRVTVRYTSLLNVELAQSLNLYGVTRAPALPTIDAASLDKMVCTGSTTDLLANTTPNNLELRWYDAPSNGNLLGTVNSGETFTTPAITEDTTFYVAAATPGCDTESARVAVAVTAIERPTAAAISIVGAENDICESSTVILVPASSIDGTYSWYFDANKTTQITDGLTQGTVTYSIDNEGKLTIAGLTATDTPIDYFVSITDPDTGCSNASGDLATATVNVITNTLNPTITLDANITADDVINISESQTTIPISGNAGGDAQAGDMVTLIINKMEYTGNLETDLSFSIPVNGSDLIADADLTIEAFVETDNGTCTSNATDTETYTLDITLPTVPTVNSQQTNDTTPIITGTADSSDDLSIVVNGVTYTEADGNLVDNTDDTWSLQIPAGNDLPEGIYDVVVTATDSAGNMANDATTNELTIDLTAPEIPTVTPLTTNSSTPTISGTATSEDELTILLNGITYTEGDGNLTDNANDTWTLVIPAANAIPDGTYDVVATATDLAGNIATDATTDELIINALAPNAPTVDFLTTNDATPILTGTAESIYDLSVEVNGVIYLEADVDLTDNGDDTWALQIPDANLIPDGMYDVKAVVSDGALSANDGTINELSIDTTPPATPTVATQATNDTTPLITGTASSEDDLTIDVNGVVYTEGDGNLTDNGDDTWALQIPDGNALPDGTYDVAATATDQVGNAATDATVDELTISTSLPAVPTVDKLMTADATPIITGTASSGDALTVKINGITYTEGDGNLTDNGDDTWALQIPDANILPDGFYDVEAVVTDQFGNTNSDTTINEVTIDTMVPTVPTVNTLMTNDSTPTITGTADSQDQLSVTVNGITYTEGDGRLRDSGTNLWSLAIPSANSIPDGVYNVLASVMDLAGNTSVDATTDELTINTELPTMPTVNELATNDSTPTITGTADSSDNLTVEVNGIVYTEGDGDLADNTDGTWTLQIPQANELPDGVYDVMATASDDMGNTSTDNTTNELSIDTTIVMPVVPTVNKLTTDDTTPVITGTATAADELTVTVNGFTYSEGAGSLVDNTDDTWTLQIPTSNVLTPNVYNVIATAVNASGGSSTDTTTNELSIIVGNNDEDPNIPTINEITTTDPTPIITGTADSADDLVVILDESTYTEGDGNLTDNGDDTWTLQVPDTNALAEGVYDVQATVTDGVGNTANDVTTDELTLNFDTPTEPTVDEIATTNPTPTITGTADSADDLVVILDGNTYTEGDGDLTDDGDNTWTLQVPDANALAEGVYDVQATATNSSGNSVSDATTDELTIESLPVSDINILKTVNNINPLVGETIEFTILITNNGETEFTNVNIDETINSGFIYKTHTTDRGYYNPSNGVWEIDLLEANQTATLTLSVEVVPTGVHSNVASIRTTTPIDDNTDNNTSEVIIELSCLTVFNEFTPNNDGYNDYFRIECIEKYPTNELRVFNRNGNKVYETVGYSNNWDGTANVNGAVDKGKKLPAGVYFYSLKIDELGEDKSGWLYIAK